MTPNISSAAPLDACPSHATVVVADDEPSIRHLLTRMLEPLGYPVVTAGDSQSALGLIESVRPGVVVCDVHMPGHSGLWLADQIRQQYPGIAIVLATGDRTIPPTQSLRRGVVAYLVKPLNRADLVRAVNEAICWSRHQALGH